MKYGLLGYVTCESLEDLKPIAIYMSSKIDLFFADDRDILGTPKIQDGKYIYPFNCRFEEETERDAVVEWLLENKSLAIEGEITTHDCRDNDNMACDNWNQVVKWGDNHVTLDETTE